MTNGAISVRLWERLVGKHRTREEKGIFQADIIGDGFDHHAVAEKPSEALFLASQRWRLFDEVTDVTPEKFDEIRAKIAAVEDPNAIAAENVRLRAALAPFAAEADEHDGASAIFSAEVPIAWLRAARAAQKGGAA